MGVFGLQRIAQLCAVNGSNLHTSLASHSGSAPINQGNERRLHSQLHHSFLPSLPALVHSLEIELAGGKRGGERERESQEDTARRRGQVS